MSLLHLPPVCSSCMSPCRPPAAAQSFSISLLSAGQRHINAPLSSENSPSSSSTSLVSVRDGRQVPLLWLQSSPPHVSHILTKSEQSADTISRQRLVNEIYSQTVKGCETTHRMFPGRSGGHGVRSGCCLFIFAPPPPVSLKWRVRRDGE